MMSNLLHVQNGDGRRPNKQTKSIELAAAHHACEDYGNHSSTERVARAYALPQTGALPKT